MSDVAFVIGRFQPYHKGHHALIHRAFQSADHVVVIVGDTGCAPDFRNPWSFEERKAWIKDIWFQEMSDRQDLSIVCVEDIPYDDAAWVASVKQVVAEVTDTMPGKRVLVGHKKDDSSFYLDLFPKWEFVEVAPQHTAGATFIREQFFSGNWERTRNMLDPNVWASLRNMPVERYRKAQAELVTIKDHDAEWECSGANKYGTQHVAVDALLYNPGYVLLIERGGEMGAGSLALPGGFVNKGERLVEAALRELEEETSIRVERSDFPSHGIGVVVPFDHPRRSMRGRIFTNVLCIDAEKISVKGFLPTPKAADDAAQADWYSWEQVESLKHRFFSDHWHIITTLKKEGFLK